MNEFGTFRSLPIKTIKQVDRSRIDLGDIEELASDIRKRGLIYPIVVDQSLKLGDGGRRIAAFELLGIPDIPALIKPGIEDINRYELELVGNLHRKDFTWHERVSLVTKIHKMYVDDPQNVKWTIRKTANRLGLSKTLVANHLQMSGILQDIPQIAECKTEQEANKMINNLEEELVMAELAKRRQSEREDTKGVIARAAEFIDQLMEEKAEAGEESEIDITIADFNEKAKAFENKEPAPIVTTAPLEDYNVADFFEATKGLPDGFLGSHSIIECDPPYGINLMDIKKGEHVGHEYEEISQANYPAFLMRLAEDCYRLMGDSSTLIFWFGVQWYGPVYAALNLKGFKVNPVPGIWYKQSFSGQSNKPTHLLSNVYETFFLAKKGDAPIGKKGSSNVFLEGVVSPHKKIHPTEKPVSLIKNIIQTSCLISMDTNCLIPFLGSGVSLVACHDLGIPAFGFDLSEKYKNAYLSRLGGVDDGA